MGWSEKYKKSINCDNPKGFSQRAHCQGRKKKMQEAKEQDHEVSMAQTQLKKSEENIKKLRKALGTKEKNIPAWVQAKITDTEHNTDAASSYMDEGKRDGKSAKDKDYSLHDWFKGGGWVQAGGKYDGKPCAKQPGQKTKPFCRDADDRAAMSKEERNKRAKKKRKEDPNPNRKGKAIMVSDSYSNWRQELELDEGLGKLALGLGAATIGGAMALGKKMGQFVDTQRKTKPSDYAVKTGLGAYAARARNAGLDTQSFKLEGELVSEGRPYKVGEPIPASATKPKSKPTGAARFKFGVDKTGMKGPEKPLGEEKDACYKKVKARYDVWPSAYASGALVKCRKVGAANWGNKTKKESFSNWREEILFEGWEDKLRKMSPQQIEDLKRSNPGAAEKIDNMMKQMRSATPKPTGSGAQMPNVPKPNPTTGARWDKGQNMRDPRAQKVYDHMTNRNTGTVNYAKEKAAAQASKTAAQARRSAKGGSLGKKVLGVIKKNKYGMLATGAALGGAYLLGKLQNSFSKAPKNESVTIENSDGTTFAEVIDIIGPAQIQAVTNQQGVWKGTSQLSNWRDELSERYAGSGHKPPAGWKPYGGYEKEKPEVDATANRIKAIRDSIKLKEDWQKVNKGDKTDGMSQKAVDAYRRENPGSKLKTAVTEKDPGPGRSKRRKSFCARSKGQQDMHNIDCSKEPDKAICKARRRWRC